MEEKVTIRSYKDSDYPAVKSVLKEAGLFGKTWDTRSNLRKKIRTTPNSIMLAVSGKDVVGCIYAQTDGWNGQLYRLGVRRAYRNRGVGTKLMKTAERFLKKKGAAEVALWAESKNKGLHRYYKKRGYNVYGSYLLLWKKL